MTRLKVKAAWVATLAGLLIAGVGVSAALADPGNGNGPPSSPPGQGECQHGNSGQECKPDPQPEHGKDCDQHGNQGGVNEDHCLGTTDATTTTETTNTNQTTTSETTTNETTTNETTTDQTTTDQTTAQETTAAPNTPTSAPPAGTSTTVPSTGTFLPPATQSAPAPSMTKPELQKALAKQATKVGTGRVSPEEARAGELPFTGFPAWIVSVIGSLLVAAGLGIRRLTP